MVNRRRSLRAVVLTLSAVWAITSCGLIDGFLDEGEDKGQDETGSALRPGRAPDDAAGPYALGAGGSAMATGGAGAGGAAGNAGSASISAAGSAELPVRPPGLNAGAPVGTARNNNQLSCDDSECRRAGGRCQDDTTCVIECDEDSIACNEEPLECPDGANCQVDCVDEDSCLDEIVCPKDGDCTINCSEVGTCQGAIDCSGSVNCTIDCDEDDSCEGGFGVRAGQAALSLICAGEGSCSGDPVECGDAGCSIACDGDRSCDSEMRMLGRLSILDCNGTQSCAGLIDCSRDEEGCQINCRGADACLRDISCGKQGESRLCDIRCLGQRTCSGNTTCLGQKCNLLCDNESCGGDVACEPGSGDCSISCDDDSCNGDVDCGADQSCALVCDGDDSCQREVKCDTRNGDCNVTCTGDNACDTVACVADNGACDLDCNGEDACQMGKAPHQILSTAFVPKRPPGRTTSTTMISRKMVISRHSARQSPTTASTNPRMKPPITQPRGLVRPPTIAAEKAFSVIERPIKAEAVLIGAISTPARPARPELITKARMTIFSTLIPTRAAARGLCATARSALPSRERASARSRPIMTATAVAATRISCGLIPIPNARMTPSPSGDGIAMGEGPQKASAPF